MVGSLDLLCGPSGCGKSSNFSSVKSFMFTTRGIRPGEVNGIDKIFLSKEEFLRLKEQNKIIGAHEYFGEYYGFSTELGDALKNGEKISEQLVFYDAIEPTYEYFKQFGDVRKNLFLGFPDDIRINLENRDGEISNRILSSLIESTHYCLSLEEFDDIHFNLFAFGKEIIGNELIVGSLTYLKRQEYIEREKEIRKSMKYVIDTSKRLNQPIDFEVVKMNGVLNENKKLMDDLLHNSIYNQPLTKKIYKKIMNYEQRLFPEENKDEYSYEDLTGKKVHQESIIPFLPFLIKLMYENIGSGMKTMDDENLNLFYKLAPELVIEESYEDMNSEEEQLLIIKKLKNVMPLYKKNKLLSTLESDLKELYGGIRKNSRKVISEVYEYDFGGFDTFSKATFGILSLNEKIGSLL